MSTPVCITGFAGISALGADIPTSLAAINAGESGIGLASFLNTEAWEYPMVAEIKNYKARDLIYDRKLLKVISKQDVLGIHAATEALKHSDILNYRNTLETPVAFNDKSGVYVASPGNKFEQQYDFFPLLAKSQGDMQVYAEELLSTVHPMWLLKILPNNVLAYTAIYANFKGANQNITNHASSGLQALIEAQSAIAAGQIDRAVVVGYDIGFEPQGLVYYGELGTLSRTSIKSFCAQREGTILGEGAGAMVLESHASAKARGAKVYGQLLAGSSVSEAQGIFSINQQADGLKRTINQTLNKAKLSGADVGMVTAHANGNLQSDATEALAINETLSASVPVTGYKWAAGHTLAAAGLLETIFTLDALRQSTVPGIPTLSTLAKDCQGINVSSQAQPCQSSIGLVINRGFGSMNASVLISASHD